MSDPLAGLRERDRKGSRAGCLLLTYGPDARVAERLTELAGGHAVVTAGRHTWAPRGPAAPAEVELPRSPVLLAEAERSALVHWWLDRRVKTTRTPNWDLVSKATLVGKEGLILVEAKAHTAELRGEEGGKRLAANASAGSLANHERIGACVREAGSALGHATGLPWDITRDRRYQMVNRFAWAWKLADLGVPVVLVYVGFLNATEMRGWFPDADAWERSVRGHAAGVVPDGVWGRTWSVHGTPFTALIRSLEMPSRAPVREAA